MSFIGPSGSGKTTLAFDFFSSRKNRILFATKKEDDTLADYIEAEKFEIHTSLPEYAPPPYRIAIWPKVQSIGRESKMYQRNSILSSMDAVYAAGHWTVLFDEVWYLSNILDLTEEMKMFYTQGRSAGISIIGIAQRPFGVPREMLNGVTHLFFFNYSDAEEIERLAGVGSGRAKDIRQIVPKLNKYEFVYINRETRYLAVSKLPMRGT